MTLYHFVLEFMLGFYVTQVITRWWNQVMSIPWPDDAMSLINGNIPKQDEESRLRRHAIARYLVLTQILAMSSVSTRVRKRFPTLEHVVDTGMMTKEEHLLLMQCTCPHIRWQLPLQWAQQLIVPLVGTGPNQIGPQPAAMIYQEFNKYRTALRVVFCYDWICLPLLITQATGVALYGYFALCLVGRQGSLSEVNTVIPFMTILKFVFYIGWFKVAQDLLRPFGEDDDDLELNYLLERHAKVAMAMADYASCHVPPLQADRFFRQSNIVLPHTKLSAAIPDRPPTTHAEFECKNEEDLKYDHCPIRVASASRVHAFADTESHLLYF